jgi:sulfoxide reductase heme-binding subunit YedZ
MTSYFVAIIVAGIMILLAALISNMIQFQGGSNPTDPKKRKTWFWVLAIITPAIFYILSAFVLAPNAEDDQMIYDEYMKVLPIASIVGFVTYLVIGFVLSKIFKNGKLGNWF